MNNASHLSSSTHDDLAARLRQQLVETLHQSGVLHSPAVQRAFLSVPRDVFVPYFYESETTSHNMTWKLITANEAGREDYLTRVYRNETLVTNIDEQGWPTSSSSLPAVMARMLEALDVHPGQRILEIGTGSGYNAALLVHLTGSSGQVITIERNGTLAATAAHTLEQETGPTVTVVVGDGIAGWPPEAPYDGIMATASLSTLPMAWVEQLRPGGRLVMDLQGTLASGFLAVEKTREGKISGSFLAEPLHFMPLQTERIMVPSVQKTALLRQPCQETFVLDHHAVFPDILFDPAYQWFLQWRIPGCQIGTYTQQQRGTASAIRGIVISDPTRNGLVRLQKQQEEPLWQGKVYGNPSLWQELQQVYDVFIHLREPPVQSYHLVVEHDQPFLLIGSLKLSLARA